MHHRKLFVILNGTHTEVSEKKNFVSSEEKIEGNNSVTGVCFRRTLYIFL